MKSKPIWKWISLGTALLQAFAYSAQADEAPAPTVSPSPVVSPSPAVSPSPVASASPAASPSVISLAPATVSYRELSDDEAEQVVPKDSDPYYQAYLKSMQDQADLGQAASEQEQQEQNDGQENIAIIDDILIGSIVVSAVVTIGNEVWKLIEMGKAVFDASSSTSAAVPKGIKSWTQLEGWKPPISKLYQTQILKPNGNELDPIYFRLVYEYGGSYKGVGKFLAGVTVMPAVETVPYLHTVYAKSAVTSASNVGTKKKPVAAMNIELDFGESNKLISEFVPDTTEQSIIFKVRGDGKVTTSPTSDASGNMAVPPVNTAPGATAIW